jgi:hypothetical protein
LIGVVFFWFFLLLAQKKEPKKSAADSKVIFLSLQVLIKRISGHLLSIEGLRTKGLLRDKLNTLEAVFCLVDFMVEEVFKSGQNKALNHPGLMNND